MPPKKKNTRKSPGAFLFLSLGFFFGPGFVFSGNNIASAVFDHIRFSNDISGAFKSAFCEHRSEDFINKNRKKNNVADNFTVPLKGGSGYAHSKGNARLGEKRNSKVSGNFLLCFVILQPAYVPKYFPAARERT